MVRDGFIVEFFGLPGVGKSTLSHRVVQILRQRGIPVREPTQVGMQILDRHTRIIKKGMFIALEMLISPKSVWLSARIIASSKQKSALDFIKTYLNWLYVSSLLRTHINKLGIHIFDEGILQALWSIAFTAEGLDLSKITRIALRSTAIPYLIVVLQANHETVERRLTERPVCHSRLEKWLANDNQLLIKASVLQNNVRKSVELFSTENDCIHILMIENDQDDNLEIVALKISDFVENKFKNR